MKLENHTIKSILDTLPIGYYLGRRLTVEFDETAETSYFIWADDKIVISAPIIKQAVRNLPDTCDIERSVRSMLYHEVGHAIMTPEPAILHIDNIVNIFEDERLETILNDYFENVDFKEQLFNITEFKYEAPHSPLDAFYQIVRFRFGKPKFVNAVSQIINKYELINASVCCNSCSECHNKYNCSPCQYSIDIHDLYTAIEKDFNSNNYSTNPNQYMNDIINSLSQDINHSQGKQTKTKNCQQCDNADTEIDIENMTEAELSEIFESLKQSTEQNAKNESRGKGEGSKANTIMKSASSRYINKSLQDKLELIFRQFNSRANMNGGAMHSYSGVFNPKNVLNNDYRYFDRKCIKGSAKGFSKFHLNLFIDRSGSYKDNEEKTNELLYSLYQLEKENSEFTFTFISCGVGQTIEKKGSFLKCNDGTELTRDIKLQFTQLQKANAVIYNIVMYDGEATDRKTHKNWSAFNTPNTTIIYERGNKYAVETYCPKAKKIYTIRFCDELIDNVIKTLSIALI